MTTVLDSSLLQDGGGSILKSLDTLAVQYEIKQMPVQGTIGWMRNHVEFTVQDDCQVTRFIFVVVLSLVGSGNHGE